MNTSARALPEWVGKTPNTAVPDTVKVRVFDKFGGRCQGPCHRDPWAYKGLDTDHIIALILWVPHIHGAPHGNRESNLQPLCDVCHPQKTAQDVAAKALTFRLKKKQYGLPKKPSRFSWMREFKRKILAQRAEHDAER